MPCSRASVIRGRVMHSKQGIIGVRVSVVGQVNLGITLTRDGGWFDLMVNGGNAIKIEFRREPFLTGERTVRVPWNEIVVIDPIELELDPSSSSTVANVIAGNNNNKARAAVLATSHHLVSAAHTCPEHNHKLMRLQLWSPSMVQSVASGGNNNQNKASLSSNKPTATSPSALTVQRDAGSLLISMPIIARGPTSSSSSTHQASQPSQANSAQANSVLSSTPQTPVTLVYNSRRANEYMSTIEVRLLPANLAQLSERMWNNLRLVHLKIVIEGNVFEQAFEPRPNLVYTYAWNRRNVYRQKSFGVATATVSLGYEYFGCSAPQQVQWVTKQVRVAGHDLSVSDVGAHWALNIHHRYNYHDNIVQRGDGRNFYLRHERALVVTSAARIHEQVQRRWRTPSSVIYAPDGALFVGDATGVRRLDPVSGQARSIVEFGSLLAATITNNNNNGMDENARYKLAIGLVDHRLYVVATSLYAIYRVRDSVTPNNATAGANLELVVGQVGLKCMPQDDGVGASACGDEYYALHARLVEPKAIAFDLRNRMYIADGATIRMVEPSDGKIYTILGDYMSAATTPTSSMLDSAKQPTAQQQKVCVDATPPMHRFSPVWPLDVAVSPLDDSVHFVDANHGVYKLTHDKRVRLLVGGAQSQLSACSLSSSSNSGESQHIISDLLADTTTRDNRIKSMAFAPNGDLYLAQPQQLLQWSSNDERLSCVAGCVGSPASAVVNKQMARRSASGADIESAAHMTDTHDGSHAIADSDDSSPTDLQQSIEPQPTIEQSRASPTLSHPTAQEFRFGSLAGVCVDERAQHVLLADAKQQRVWSLAPDVPRANARGDYELVAPGSESSNEVLVFNRHGHHVATRSRTTGANIYTFAYSASTAFGRLNSVIDSTGNKMVFLRDANNLNVKMIESTHGTKCTLDMSKSGQLHSITTSHLSTNTLPLTSTHLNSLLASAPATPTFASASSSATAAASMMPQEMRFAYTSHDSGLLRNALNVSNGDAYEFSYDEHGLVTHIARRPSSLSLLATH
ncbi:Teneurin-m [Fragariocoptes setiger]|uniref:Teneurin-m n=1 Tax=Fragariocoptes setiger TaxID=1670756 RepID=A0ABQ7S586_9ACAR|nr:Teneurin-m [Fragariocoptes setiger]